GRRPADQETIRHTGFHGHDEHGDFYLMREVLGGGSGGRFYADGYDTIHVVPDSKNLPVEFTETRFPLVVERLALAPDSGGAGKRRGGLGYLKEFRVLRDSYFSAWPIARSSAAGASRAARRGDRSASPSIPVAHGSACFPASSTTSRSSRGRSCASRRPVAVDGAIRSSGSPTASPSTCCRARSAPARPGTTTVSSSPSPPTTYASTWSPRRRCA